MEDVLDALENIDEITNARWVPRDNRYHKGALAGRGEDVGHFLKIASSKSFKNMYTIFIVNTPSLSTRSKI